MQSTKITNESSPSESSNYFSAHDRSFSSNFIKRNSKGHQGDQDTQKSQITEIEELNEIVNENNQQVSIDESNIVQADTIAVLNSENDFIKLPSSEYIQDDHDDDNSLKLKLDDVDENNNLVKKTSNSKNLPNQQVKIFNKFETGETGLELDNPFCVNQVEKGDYWGWGGFLLFFLCPKQITKNENAKTKESFPRQVHKLFI